MVKSFKNLDSVITHWAQITPDNEVAVEGDERLSYTQLEMQIIATATMLISRNISRGDRVGVMADASISYLILLMAISRIGAIYVGINPRYEPNEIAHILKVTKPVLILVENHEDDPSRQERVLLGMRKNEKDIPLYCINSYRDLTPSQTKTDDIASSSVSSPEDIAVIVFTSGSTGQPKGAALHHSGLLAAAICQSDHVDGEARRYLSNLPINHVGGVMNLTLGCLVGGGTLVFQRKFDPADTLRLIEQEKISSWLQVPAMFTMCVRHKDFANTNLSSLHSICIGGGAVSAPTLALLRNIGAKIFVEYGQSETMSTLSFSEPDANDEVLLNTIGNFIPQFDSRIANADNSECKVDETGEIQARGNCVLRNYWGQDEATKTAFTSDGWLKTGDLAVRRKDNNIVLKGRTHEMIKSGGYNVYPREVEQILETHPDIAEIVVHGATDETYGEIVCAAIELAPDVEPSKDTDIYRDFCRGKIAGYKIPKKFKLSNALARLPNGKLDRTSIGKQ